MTVFTRVNEMTGRYRRKEVPFEEVVRATPNEGIEVKRAKCVTPQWEPTAEFADAMFKFFDVTPEEYLHESH
jgi:hypothetical protein